MTSVLTKPIANPFKRAAAEPRIEQAVPTPGVGPVYLRGIPRADLLPPSVHASRKAQRTVRRILQVLALSVVIAILASAAAFLRLAGSESELMAARSETDSLIAQQAGFADVNAAQSSIDRLTAARAVVGAMDVDWAGYLADVRGTLPEGMTLSGASIEATTPVSVLTASTSVLSGARVASLQLSVESADLGSVQGWVDKLAGLPGFVDSSLGSVTQGGSGYQAVVMLGLGEEIYSGRYATEVAE